MSSQQNAPRIDTENDFTSELLTAVSDHNVLDYVYFPQAPCYDVYVLKQTAVQFNET